MGAEVAARRLELAVTEQERAADAYAQAAGTTRELTCFVRLQASNLQVAVCNRMVGGIGRPAARQRAES
jgi:hypothetical protein